MREYFLGLMSGTSMDGIDAALVAFDEGPAEVVASSFTPWTQTTRERLATAGRGGFLSPVQLCELDALAGYAFATAAAELIATSGVPRASIRAIGSHGQTLAHLPGGETPGTLQVGDPNVIAELTGVDTVADFRRRDMAAGGQGAPLAPAFHDAVFRHSEENRVVLNLGGIANVTVLDADPSIAVTGFDTGPANCLMDHWCTIQLGEAFDRDGTWAASGTVIESLLADMLNDPYFAMPPPKSTGTQYFSAAWLQHHLAACGETAAADVQATLMELTVRSVTGAIARHGRAVARILVCGGGAYNGVLLERLRHAGIPVESTAAHGVPPDQVEAAAFAWLAHRHVNGLPGNLPGVTGARGPRILGCLYPA